LALKIGEFTEKSVDLASLLWGHILSPIFQQNQHTSPLNHSIISYEYINSFIFDFIPILKGVILGCNIDAVPHRLCSVYVFTANTRDARESQLEMGPTNKHKFNSTIIQIFLSFDHLPRKLFNYLDRN
jgi:hypothetical protein